MRQQLTEETERLTMVANTLHHPLEVQDDALEFLLLQTVKKLATALVRRELQTDSGHILSVVKEAVAALPVGSKNLSLYLNPDDLALVENYAEEQKKDWTFVGDAELLPGGCRLETKESLVDFSVETHMQTLLQEFESKQLAAEEPDAVVAEAEQQARLHSQKLAEGEFVAGQAQSLAQNVSAGDTDNIADTRVEEEFAEGGGDERSDESVSSLIGEIEREPQEGDERE